MDRTVIVGKIGAPYGVRGWVKIYSYTEPSDNIFTYPVLLEASPNSRRTIKIEQFKTHGDCFIAKLAGIDDRDAAALITNAQLAVYRSDFPELEVGEYYLDDLIGMTVYNQDNVKLGTVKEFFATGANDILVVQDDNAEHLIPFVPEMFVIDIDLSCKKMQVRWELEF